MTNKLKAVFNNVVYASTDESLSKCKQDNNGVLKLPLISVYRVANVWTDDLDHGHIWLGRSNHDGSRTLSFKLDITYQIDIWSVERLHTDGILCDLIFYLVDYPNLSLDIPDHGHEDFSLRITGIDSEIDTSSFEDTGRLYRNTITLESTVSVFRSTDSYNWVVKLVDILPSDDDDFVNL
jgi:hypothetical protein